MTSLADRIEAAIGARPTQLKRLSGGCIGDVFRADLPDGSAVVAKVADGSGARLGVEGEMLRYLAEHSRLPVPTVLSSTDTLLIMTFVEGYSHFNDRAQAHAAELLADLHSVQGRAFGFEGNTVLAGLPQQTPMTEHWIPYFREHRLLYMARLATEAGRMPAEMERRVRRLSERLDEWLEEPDYPSLIHGDVWTTNVLALGDRITAFLDPAIYYAHPEIELAFTTLFNTFDAPFFERYHEIRPISPGFFEARRDLYNLYPLLTHVRLFGGGYVGAVDRILRRFGY